MPKKAKLDTAEVENAVSQQIVETAEPTITPVRKEVYKHPTKTLLKSKVFAKYRKEFVAALLPEPAYTMAEARRIVETYFKEAKR